MFRVVTRQRNEEAECVCGESGRGLSNSVTGVLDNFGVGAVGKLM